MGNQKHTSQVKVINWNTEVVYGSLSNLEFLNFLFLPENMERVKQQLGDKADKFNIEDFTADQDSCSFKISPIGTVSLRIVERENLKLIKLISEKGTPIQFTFWIQILPVNETSCKIRLTLQTELNMMMKMVVGNKLEKGIEQIAEAFTQMPFDAIYNFNQNHSNHQIS